MAVAGIGGLGHMAVQIAKALGAEVTALTTSPGKADDVRALGADHVIVMSDIPALGKAEASFDLVLSTIPYPHDVEPYLNLVAHDGVLHFVGNFMPTTVSFMPLLFQRRTIDGLADRRRRRRPRRSWTSAPSTTSGPRSRLIAIGEVNEAFQRVIDEDIRFRHVIDMASLRDLDAGDADELEAPVRGLPAGRRRSARVGLAPTPPASATRPRRANPGGRGVSWRPARPGVGAARPPFPRRWPSRFPSGPAWTWSRPSRTTSAAHFDLEVGTIAAEAFLDYALAEIGPSVYNKAVRDAQSRLSSVVSDLDLDLSVQELGYSLRKDAARRR